MSANKAERRSLAITKMLSQQGSSKMKTLRIVTGILLIGLNSEPSLAQQAGLLDVNIDSKGVMCGEKGAPES